MEETPTARKKKKRRTRSPHPGVVIEKPTATRKYHRARFVEGERIKKVRLDPLVVPTADARRDWAIRKSRELGRVRMEEAIDPRRARMMVKSLSDAIKDYFASAQNRLGESTIALYRAAATLFESWAERESIERTVLLTAVRLPGFRDYLLAQRKQGYTTGGGRGKRVPTKHRLSPLTINWQLRAVKTVLNDFRSNGLVPLSSDDIADALKPVAAPRNTPEFLRPDEIRQLLEAALRHDTATYAATREEHAGLRPIGTTLRYEPITPFVLTVLLTGMRRSEALALRWSAVDFKALDADGKVAGEIRLMAEDTKTKHARTIRLDVSPSVRVLLSALKLRAGRDVYVFGGSSPMPKTTAEAARRCLIKSFGAPAQFSWQLLRSTCATFQCNAPGVFGDAAVFASAKRLGHSVTVAEKHYAGLFVVSRDAKTLEAAMKIEALTKPATVGTLPVARVG